MSQKNVKLLSRFAAATNRDHREVKEWYAGLNAPQRDEAVKMMRETVYPPAPEPKKS